MTVTAKALQPGIKLGTGDTTLYTCPTGTRAVVWSATFNNTDVSARTFSVRVVRSGASPDNFVINTQALATLKTYVSPELVNVALNAGDYIVGNASAAAVIGCIINGAEIVQ